MGTRASIEILSHGVAETVRVAACVAGHLQAGDVVALIGDLGTGKTRFVEGAVRALGYAGRVRSPSYTLLCVYRARLPVYHLDLYRWEDEAGLEMAEWEELMEGDGVAFVEWAERLGSRLPERAVDVRLEHAGGNRRRLRLSLPAERFCGLIRELSPDSSDQGGAP